MLISYILNIFEWKMINDFFLEAGLQLLCKGFELNELCQENFWLL